ncbi:MAG TPA: asparagine synthase-related protein [Gemmatimonadaceae bacterium]|nr:asparagine synthase-related protein [Gemmatimonadaceae bacterium]
MSAILGVFGTAAGALAPERVRLLLAAMARRGADRTAVRQAGFAWLGVARYSWELDPQFSGPVLTVHEGPITVVADASLYYRRDLECALAARGVRLTGHTSAHLILAAYRAWGDDCAARLEGDFAFIVWDSRRHVAVAARDFGGKRPLFHAQVGEAMVIASTIAGILAHPACSRELNLAALAEDASALTGSSDETAWRAVRRIPAGATLLWREGGAPRVGAHWQPPAFRDVGGTPFDDAAEELRELLDASVAERLSTRGTSIGLSGGWDSPAVFACGQRVVRAAADRSLHAMSMSYPPGDPGREDELIAAIVAHWNTDTRWIRGDDVPALARFARRAGERDEPLPHPFEAINRVLATTSASLGDRVMFDGNGGDQLFQVSIAYLADLLARGRWPTLAREWRQRAANGRGCARDFLRDVVAPALPAMLVQGAEWWRGSELRTAHPLQRHAPRWIRADFLARHCIAERERAHVPPRGHRSRASHELGSQLVRPMIARMSGAVSRYALEAGVELRCPLYDGRIIRFAASRPVLERRSGWETKRLLRRAMAGLLPEHVLAPRPYRTGVPVRYLTRALRDEIPRLLGDMTPAPLLADLGIIDPAVLRAAWADAMRRADAHAMIAVYVTVEAEYWLRAHTGSAHRPTSHAANTALHARRAVEVAT